MGRSLVTKLVSIPICAFIGIIIAGILEVANTQGHVVDEYIAGSILLTDIQIVTVIIFTFIGGVYAAMSR